VGAAAARVLGANDAIRLAVVGVGSTIKIGGKGKGDARDFAKIPGVRVTAFCDVDHANLDPEVKKWRDRGEPVEAYTDVRKLLENKDIDAVSVTTPNHWHALVTVWACQAGKDVFVQKPASHNLFEGRKMVEAARKYKRIVQCPSNSRSPNGFQEAAAWARQGNLGRIRYVHGVNFGARTSIGKVAGPQRIPDTIDYDLWCGPSPVLPLKREYLHYDWHWQWPYGDGELGNWGPHILDGCRIALGEPPLPRRVIALGGRFGYADDGETPNSQLMLYDYEPAPILFEIRGLPKDRSFLATPWDKGQNKTMDTYCGIRQGPVIHCEGGYVALNKAYDKDGKLIRQFEPTTPNLNVNFIEAMRSRRAGDLVADILPGHMTVALIHMANISYRLGKNLSAGEIKERITGETELLGAYERFKDHLRANDVDVDRMIAGPMLTLDPERERFTGDFSAAANKLARGEYRRGFVVPEKV
jgi:hypothetical protein